jgi:hypothetical protein
MRTGPDRASSGNRIVTSCGPLLGVSSMRSFVLPAALSLFVLFVPAALGAQARPNTPPPPNVPANQMPPAGKCRVWIEGVAPAQQPAPTDCQTALRLKPPNGTVIFGPPAKDRDARTFDTQPPRVRPPARRVLPPSPVATPVATPVPTSAGTAEKGKAPPRDTTPTKRPRRPARDSLETP